MNYYIIVWFNIRNERRDGVMKAFTAQDAAFQFQIEFPNREIREIEPVLLTDARIDEGLVSRTKTQAFVWPLTQYP